jgi:hypothetical protein
MRIGVLTANTTEKMGQQESYTRCEQAPWYKKPGCGKVKSIAPEMSPLLYAMIHWVG